MEEFFYIGDAGGVYFDCWSENDLHHRALYGIGNCFKSKEEAFKAHELLKWLAEDWRRWEKIKIWKELCERGEEGELEIGLKTNGEITPCWGGSNPPKNGVPMFHSIEAAQNAIAEIGEERLRKFWFFQ